MAKKEITAKTKLMVIGIGNESRADDGVGLYIAERLEQRYRGGIKVLKHRGGTTNLIHEWEGFDKVIICDAVHSGQRAGFIYRFDYPKDEFPEEIFRFSTHTFSLGQVLELAKLLNHLPKEVIIYGIEGKFFTVGDRLSPEVQESVSEVIERIRKDIDRGH